MLKKIRHAKIFTLAVAAAFLCAMTPQAHAASAAEIDRGVSETLEKFKNQVNEGGKLLLDAKGVLVLPAVYKAGIGIGGEFGEGALLINGKTAEYYNMVAASFGFQLGAEKKSIVVLFMEPSALDKFRAGDGWKAGVDASITVVALGAAGELDTTKLNQPILGFVINQKGLMYNLTLEGAKFTKIQK